MPADLTAPQLIALLREHPGASNPWVWVVEFKRIAGGAA